MKKITILYIAIGDYVCFWDEFYQTFQEKFLPGYTKDYWIFTDREDAIKAMDDVHVIHQDNLGWPGNTLFRFDMFLRVKENVGESDYIFFFNANYTCAKKVNAEDLGDLQSNLTFVIHPGFYGLKNYYYNYDRHKNSLAYVPYGEGEFYVQGCLIGGKPGPFWEMSEELSENIHTDQENGIIAEWHDESHINRYAVGRNDCLFLNPGFAFPEFAQEQLSFEQILVLRDKEKYIQYKTKKKRSAYTWYNKKIRIKGNLMELFHK